MADHLEMSVDFLRGMGPSQQKRWGGLFVLESYDTSAFTVSSFSQDLLTARVSTCLSPNLSFFKEKADRLNADLGVDVINQTEKDKTALLMSISVGIWTYSVLKGLEVIWPWVKYISDPENMDILLTTFRTKEILNFTNNR